MASAGPRDPDSRRTGVVRRSGLPSRQGPPETRNWLAIAFVGLLAAVVLLLILIIVSRQPDGVAVIPTATPAATATATLPPFVQATPSPSPTPSASLTPSPSPSPMPTPTPTPPPTPSPSASASATPTVPAATSAPTTAPPLPSAPQLGLVVTEPADGAVVGESAIVIRGLTQPGATVTRVRDFWFDEHVIADSNGRWAYPANLSVGRNVFTFRVADDTSTVITLTVEYDPL